MERIKTFKGSVYTQGDGFCYIKVKPAHTTGLYLRCRCKKCPATAYSMGEGHPIDLKRNHNHSPLLRVEEAMKLRNTIIHRAMNDPKLCLQVIFQQEIEKAPDTVVKQCPYSSIKRAVRNLKQKKAVVSNNALLSLKKRIEQNTKRRHFRESRLSEHSNSSDSSDSSESQKSVRQVPAVNDGGKLYCVTIGDSDFVARLNVLEQHLPKSFRSQIFVNKDQSVAIVYCNLTTVEDIDKWVCRFSQKTSTKWAFENNGFYARRNEVCRKMYTCQGSAEKVDPLYQECTDTGKCRAYLKCKIKRPTERAKYTEPYMKDGLCGEIVIGLLHSHSIQEEVVYDHSSSSDIEDTINGYKGGKNEDDIENTLLKNVFFAFFRVGLGTEEALSEYNKIQAEVASSSEQDHSVDINVTPDAVNCWYNEWKGLSHFHSNSKSKELWVKDMSSTLDVSRNKVGNLSTENGNIILEPGIGSELGDLDSTIHIFGNKNNGDIHLLVPNNKHDKVACDPEVVMMDITDVENFISENENSIMSVVEYTDASSDENDSNERIESIHNVELTNVANKEASGEKEYVDSVTKNKSNNSSPNTKCKIENFVQEKRFISEMDKASNSNVCVKQVDFCDIIKLLIEKHQRFGSSSSALASAVHHIEQINIYKEWDSFLHNLGKQAD